LSNLQHRFDQLALPGSAGIAYPWPPHGKAEEQQMTPPSRWGKRLAVSKRLNRDHQPSCVKHLLARWCCFPLETDTEVIPP